ncbi:MAG: HNH endonuclease signature motif containing protein [Gemmatimonadetes bacterium]|nr:HNH endonuclease signature motif containing protein [Gemmatimonadota bacterium]
MNLPDFKQHELFNRFRRMMNARLVDWSEGGLWNSIDIDEILETTGHDISPEELTIAGDGTLEYKGRKVVVYIRDQRVQYQPYKFHVADCKKLTEMRDNDRYHRYVVSNRTDGTFTVNSYDRGQIVEKDATKKMSICRYCLIRLNYNGYANRDDQSRNRILESFELDKFFRRYSSHITIEPTHTNVTAPADSYTVHWEQISRLFKARKNWQCEECQVSLYDRRMYLHVHHKDGDKNNNKRENLQALCIACHAKLPHHDHLTQQPEYIAYINWKHTIQGPTHG